MACLSTTSLLIYYTRSMNSIYESFTDGQIKSIASIEVTTPEYFGPFFRGTLEILALTSPKWYWEMIKIIEKYLPCEECREHAQFKIQEIPNTLHPFAHCIALHNLANKFQGKKEYKARQRLLEIIDTVATLDI